MKESRIIVGLDIGTTKITTVIGELSYDGTLDIIGEGTVQSDVLKKGTVVNLERTTEAIKKSMAAAERVAGVSVHEVFVSVSGSHIKAITSHGLAAIRRNQEIKREDVERAIENAQAVDLGGNLEVIHTQPQEFKIDGQEGIKNPVGMQGVRLEVDVHIVAGASGPLANLRRCVNEAGVNTGGVVLQAYASGLGVLDSHELETTVVVVDIGGSVTDVGVFRRGNLAHSAVIPIGGDHVTTDLSQLFKIPPEEAARIKRKHGSALPELADPDLSLEINQPGGIATVSAFDLARVIKPRVSEIMDLVRREIDDALGPVELLASSVVLTGGGSLLRGMTELARDRFRLPVRVGGPRGLGGLSDVVDSPLFATSVGLLRYAVLSSPQQPVAAPVPVQEKVGRRQVIAVPPQPASQGGLGQPGNQGNQRGAPERTPVQSSVNGTSHGAASSERPSSEVMIDTTPVRPKTPASTVPNNSSTQGKGIIDRVREFFKDFF